MAKTSITNMPAGIEQGTNALRDIKPPVHVPGGWEWAWWLAGILAALLLGYLAWRFWLRRRAATPQPVIVPPNVRARQKLQEALSLIGSPKAFCVLVSDTIRYYLEERFDFHAPERTTEEFLHELGATSLLSVEQKRSLSDFLARCDLVKFAKYEPAEPELRDLHGAALRLVDETAPLAPAPVDATATHASSATVPAPDDGPNRSLPA